MEAGGKTARTTGAANRGSLENSAKIIAEAEADVLKFDGGNKAAGTRVRKSMQDVKAAVQEIPREGVGKPRCREAQLRPV